MHVDPGAEPFARGAEELERAMGIGSQKTIDDLCVATPQEFERQITGATDEDDDVLLPSVGTEADTARRFRMLAHEGHHALIVHANAGMASEHVLAVLKELPISYGQRYRHLVIEDLVEAKR